MLTFSYTLQAFAVCFMLGSLVVIALSLKNGNYLLVAINLFLFAMNAGLFYWQGVIRASL